MQEPSRARDDLSMKRRIPHRTATTAVTFLASLTGYLALIGWDQRKTLGSDGYLHGPYETWQVGALCAVVALAAVWAGWRRGGRVASLSAAAAITAAFSVDAATDPENDGLWGVGAVTVLVATYLGCRLCTLIGAWLRRRRGQRDLRSRDPRDQHAP